MDRGGQQDIAYTRRQSGSHQAGQERQARTRALKNHEHCLRGRESTGPIEESKNEREDYSDSDWVAAAARRAARCSARRETPELRG
jgi:hypothetical protein